MRSFLLIILTVLFLWPITALTQKRALQFDFYGDTLNLTINLADTTAITGVLPTQMVKDYEKRFSAAGYHLLADTLVAYKRNNLTDDWIYYQLIRKAAQEISPKQNNYERYTVLKWFLLTRSGYNATLKYGAGRLLFYVQTDDAVFNLPFYYKDNKQFVCLNYHDYGYFELNQEKYEEIKTGYTSAGKPFSYKVTRIPEGQNSAYVEKELRFNYYESINHFTVKLNPSIQQMFANYPVVDYESYFNIPLSRQTYQSLIPGLKKHLAGKKIKKGVDFIMRFTRYAFLFETDSTLYGREKRLTPEQTLLHHASDCEDRAALFFYLIKEIYNLPMIVLSYPDHVTIAVQLQKPVGMPVMYNGKAYTITEPTPQKEDLGLGKLLPSLVNTPFEVVYVYDPDSKK